MFAAGSQGSQTQNSTVKEESESKPNQTIFNNVGTQNNIYINAPTSKLKDNNE